MKVTVTCGRCDTNVDIEEGLKISTCYSPIDRRFIGHAVEVDDSNKAGNKILQHFDRKARRHRVKAR